MKFSPRAFWFLTGLLLTACKGPILVDDDAPQRIQVPAGVSEDNAMLQPRKSPLSVGAPPPNFLLSDQKGALVSAGELTSGKGSVVIFVPPDSDPAARPAYSWAKQNQNILGSRGLEVLLVTPHNSAINSQIAEREGLRLALLSDPSSWVGRAFGVVPRGQPAPRRPFTFVLGSNGLIQLSAGGLPTASDPIMAAETLPGKHEESLFSPF